MIHAALAYQTASKYTLPCAKLQNGRKLGGSWHEGQRMKKGFREEHAWLCPIGSLLLAGLILIAFGLTWWDSLLLIGMLACPLNWLWLLFFDDKRRRL